MIWQTASRKVSLDQPLLMGILNVTPDSFSDGGLWVEPENAVHFALQMEMEGASIIDIGGESSRPGAVSISAEEETARVIGVVRALRKKSGVLISIDTTKHEVAEACLAAGADIVNDVSGLGYDGEKMAEVVRRYSAGLILMHRRGDAQSMQSLAHYQDTVLEVVKELRGAMEQALAWGIAEDQVILDPGLGFSKTPEQNLDILRQIDKFHELNRPLLLGPSRKSFLGKITGKPVGERAFATAAAVAYCLLHQIKIIRVHDPGAMQEVLQVIQAIQGECHVRSFKMGNH